MAGRRLVRFDPSLTGWALLAVLLAAGGGVLVGAAPAAAFDIGAIGLAAALVARYPFPALVTTLLLRAALPNSVLIGVLLLGAGAVAVIACAPRLPGKRVVVPFLALLLIALIKLPLSPSVDEGPVSSLRLPLLGADYASAPSTELLGWVNLASVLTCFCLAGWAVTTPARLKRLVTAILLAALVPLAIAFQQLALGETVTRTGSTLKSLRGPFTHPNYFAFYLVVILILAIVVLMESRVLATRIAVAGLIAASMVCLFLTYTRGAWIGFAFALVALALLRYRKLLIVALVATALAALVAPTAATKAQQRFGDLTSKSEANDSNSWTWRVDQWKQMVPYGLHKPLTGEGFGSYSRITVEAFGHSDPRYPTVQKPFQGVYSPTGFTAHNDYVKMLVEMGFPGLVLWVLVSAGVVSVAARARRRPELAAIASGALAIALGQMLISVSDNLQGYTVVLMYGFAVCGGLAGLSSRKRAPELAIGSSDLSPAAVTPGPEEPPVPQSAELPAETRQQTPIDRPSTGARAAATSAVAWLRRSRARWRR